MKLFEQIERLNLIHKLIDEERTGSPEYFAERLNISKRQLHNIIDDLKMLGAPICYDSFINSYRYERSFFLGIDVNIEFLTEDEKNAINGGCFLPECNFISLDSFKFVNEGQPADFINSIT
ncbi:MAG: HTH domain-containing protein [Dysgonomonas sp.]